MTNLKTETVDILKENGKTKEDVLWCGSKEFGWFSFDDFLEVAPTDYDSGFGGQKIAKDLLIVGKDFWLERHEYDGSEWWEYKEMSTKPENYKKPRTLEAKIGWNTLKELDEED